MEDPDLNPAAREAMKRARAAAVERGRQRAEYADILIALLDSDDATRVLHLFVDDVGKIRTGLSFITMYPPPWSSETDSEERTVDQARAEAAALGQAWTGPEHLLLGLVGQTEAVAAGLLLALGLSIETARQAVRHVHGEAPDWQPPEEPESLPPASASMTMRAMNSVVPGITFEEAESLRDALMAPFLAGSSRLERVLAIGQTAEVSGGSGRDDRPRSSGGRRGPPVADPDRGGTSPWSSGHGDHG